MNPQTTTQSQNVNKAKSTDKSVDVNKKSDDKKSGGDSCGC
jgi:hypothetical protein